VSGLLQELALRSCLGGFLSVHYTTRQFGADCVCGVPVLTNREDFGAAVDRVDMNPLLFVDYVEGFDDLPWFDFAAIRGDTEPMVVNDGL